MNTDCLSSDLRFRPNLYRRFVDASLSPITFEPRRHRTLPWSVVMIIFTSFFVASVCSIPNNDECLNHESVSERYADSSGAISFSRAESDLPCASISTKFTTIDVSLFEAYERMLLA